MKEIVHYILIIHIIYLNNINKKRKLLLLNYILMKSFEINNLKFTNNNEIKSLYLIIIMLRKLISYIL